MEEESVGTGGGGGTNSHCKSWLFAEPANSNITPGIIECFMFMQLVGLHCDIERTVVRLEQTAVEEVDWCQGGPALNIPMRLWETSFCVPQAMPCRPMVIALWQQRSAQTLGLQAEGFSKVLAPSGVH